MEGGNEKEGKRKRREDGVREGRGYLVPHNGRQTGLATSERWGERERTDRR